MNVVGLPLELFPEQVASSALVGEITTSAAHLLSVRSGTPVVAGAPDGTAGATFVIGDDNSLIADVAGTTDVIVRLLAAPEAAAQGAVINPYTLGTGWTAGGATGTTGGALALWASLFRLGSPAEALKGYAAEIEALPAGANGLSIDPSVSGSRFPRWRPGDRGSVKGQSGAHGHAHFLRAAQEGAAYVVREGVDLLAGDRQRSPTVVLAGGAAKSSFLAQLRADVFGRDVLVCTSPDVSLMGSSLFAMLGVGIHADAASALDSMRAPLRLVEHDSARAAEYDRLYQDWRSDQDA